MPDEDIKVTIEPKLRGDALVELEARIKRVSTEMARAGDLARNIKFEGVQQEMTAAESLLVEKRAALERMQGHVGAAPSVAGANLPGLLGGGGGGLDLGTIGNLIGGRAGGALSTVAIAKQTFDTAFHAAYAPAAKANQIAIEKQAADTETIQRCGAVLRAGKQADGGMEAAALATSFHEQREALQSQRGAVMDTDGPLDDLKHASDAIFGEGLRNKIGEWSKNWFGQNLTQTSGERQEETNDEKIARLKNDEKLATGMAKRKAREAAKAKETELKEQPQPQGQPPVQPETKAETKAETKDEPKTASAQQPLAVQRYARLVAARDGAADTARVATFAHQKAPQQADGGALERLRQDMNRNHLEATHMATRKHFSRP